MPRPLSNSQLSANMGSTLKEQVKGYAQQHSMRQGQVLVDAAQAFLNTPDAETKKPQDGFKMPRAETRVPKNVVALGVDRELKRQLIAKQKRLGYKSLSQMLATALMVYVAPPTEETAKGPVVFTHVTHGDGVTMAVSPFYYI